MKTKAEHVRSLRGVLDLQRFGVLATHDRGQPYGSLVAFAATPDLKRLVFATERATRKYANLTADGRVAMVIDTSSNRDSDLCEASAVTATGRVREVKRKGGSRYRQLFVAKHPRLESFVSSPDCALLTIEVERYGIVSHFEDVTELSMKRTRRS